MNMVSKITQRILGTITVKEKPANDSGILDSQEAVATAQGAPKPDVEYEGNVILVILLKKASDQRKIHMTPDQISRQIKNTQGGSVVSTSKLGKEYLIQAHFETPVSLNAVLDGVSDWEDFQHRGDQVKNYQKRALAVLPFRSSNAKRILVTL